MCISVPLKWKIQLAGLIRKSLGKGEDFARASFLAVALGQNRAEISRKGQPFARSAHRDVIVRGSERIDDTASFEEGPIDARTARDFLRFSILGSVFKIVCLVRPLSFGKLHQG